MIFISRASLNTVRNYFFVYSTRRKLFLRTMYYSTNCIKNKNVILDHRLLNYISIKQMNIENNNKSENLKVQDLKILNNNDLLLLIFNLFKENDNKYLQREVKKLDIECCRRLPELNNSDLLLFLYTLAKYAPYYVRNLRFYTQALNKIHFSINGLLETELIPICFYAGLKKKCSESQRIIKYCLNKFNNKKILKEFKLEDIIIICNSSFKTSTRISQNYILEEIKTRIYDQLNILNDESYFITIVKSLRHNYNYDEELLSTISNTMFFNKILNDYNFTALSHILTLYADALYYDEKLIKTVNNYCIQYLRKSSIVGKREHFSTQLRFRDLSRFLWSLSYLGYEDLKENDVYNLILPLVNSFIELGNVENNIEEFVGTLLSLCVIGHYPTDILSNILKEKLLVKGRHKNSFVSRLNLLLTSIKIEQPNIFHSLQVSLDPSPSYNINIQIGKRPDLIRIKEALKDLSEKYELSSIEYSYAIPHLNIAGITCYSKNNKILAYIECVDDTNSTKYKEFLPHGFMKLKLRLLKTTKKPLLVVDKDDILEMNSSKLMKYLDKKLKIAIYLSKK